MPSRTRNTFTRVAMFFRPVVPRSSTSRLSQTAARTRPERPVPPGTRGSSARDDHAAPPDRSPSATSSPCVRDEAARIRRRSAAAPMAMAQPRPGRRWRRREPRRRSGRSRSGCPARRPGRRFWCSVRRASVRWPGPHRLFFAPALRCRCAHGVQSSQFVVGVCGGCNHRSRPAFGPTARPMFSSAARRLH